MSASLNSVPASFVSADEFNVYTHEAGAGVLAVGIDGPSKAAIDIIDRQTGFVTVSYIVQSAGESDTELHPGVRPNRSFVRGSVLKLFKD